MQADATRTGRAQRAVVASALLAAVIGVGTGTLAPAPAGGQTGPTVHLSDHDVREGQQVGVELAGFPVGYTVVVECSTGVLTSPADGPSLCGVRTVLALPGPAPSTATFTAVSSFPSYDGTRTIDCRAEPAGCVAGVVTLSDVGNPRSVIASAYEPLRFVPSFAGTPDLGLVDGQTISVTGALVDPGAWSLAQCGRDVLDDPTPEAVAALCGPATAVTVGDEGSFVAPLVVHEPLVPTGGGSVACGHGDCVVVLSSAGEPVATSFHVAFGPAAVDLAPAEDIPEGSPLTVSVRGGPEGQVHAHICVDPAPERFDTGTCSVSGVYFELDDVGSGSTSDAYATSSFPFEGSCRIEACVFAVYRGADGPTPLVGQSAPLDFAPPPELTISPTTGLHAGDPIAGIAENLVPGGTYDWAVCADAACDGGEVLHADTDGRLAFTAPASPYTHSGVPYGYCRDDCRVEVHGIGTDNRSPSVSATYAVAAGTVTATPSTGLADGQAVQVEGTDLVRTYEGPTLWIFPTGGWALTQCDRTGSTTSRWAGCSSTAPPDRRPGA